ncbi:hypothetical protein PMAYCL1PPCAC_03758, partial [Pristionchus mayeri]
VSTEAKTTTPKSPAAAAGQRKKNEGIQKVAGELEEERQEQEEQSVEAQSLHHQQERGRRLSGGVGRLRALVLH